MQQALWFGGYHYGVWTTDRVRGKKVQLFEFLKDALKEAKFALYNNDGVSVIDLTESHFTGKVLYQSVNKKKLRREKP